LPDVRLVNVTKRFGRIIAVDHVSLEVRDQEYTTLLGPSGCGKTTTLRLIAGLAEPDVGEIYIANKPVSKLPPEDRGVGFVFQNYALFPHMDLWGNTTYGPKVKGWDEEKTKRLANEMLELVRLAERKDAFPSELSGGMQQRAALARALSAGTNLLLLDEPLGALDAKIRTQLRYELRRLVKDLGLTAIHVTHDQEEAMTISDKIVVMRRGAIEQIGRPEQLYLAPNTPFIASFIGESNFFEGSIVKVSGNTSIVELRGELLIEVKCAEWKEGERVVIAVRPENIKLGPYAPADLNFLPGLVERIQFIGGILRYEIRLVNDDVVTSRVPIEAEKKFEIGEKTTVTLDSAKVHVYRYPKEGLIEAIKVE
jgi:ABC-type Fe3+/spermidine/putrescine transport system ATPase subunit